MAMEEPWSFTVDGNKRSQQKRARFNLLSLDHGEYYFQDYSAYFYPSTSTVGSASNHHRPRQQGRLKLCSRGLLFEPADRLLPLVKYPFRHMETQMERVGGISGGWGDAEDKGGFGGGGGRSGEGFRFRCTVVVESRRNDEVGPYETKKAGGSGAAGEWSDWTFSFSLLHTPLGEFLGEARRLREVALRVKERGHGYEEPLLSPLLQERLRDSTRKFDTIHLVDFRETLLLPCPVRVDRITPLLRNPGCIMVTDARVYFQPAELNNVGEPVASFPLAGVVRVFKRRHMLRQTGLELFMQEDGGSAFFNFESSKERDELFDVLMSQPLVGRRAESARDIEKETRRWQAGQVSNYEYLVFLNTVAGRTVNDLTQYPVFPWVLRDYESETLDLDDPEVYRDLSRPIGALDPERLEYFRERLRNMPDPALHPDSGLPPPFLYGTHYSTPGYTLFFLVRAAPEEMLCLQNGRFDDPDRSFISVKGAWDSVLKNQADLKELIPEFYAGDGFFLTNRDNLPLGVTQSGQRVGDVELPPWARNPRDFVRKMRRALESPYVSRRLHLWIDLVFGCRQRGRAAIEADNLFYHLTYEGAVDLEKIDDPRERAALESQISEFGQCPSQLFRGPHPRRDSPSSPVLLQNPAPLAVGQRLAGVFATGIAMMDRSNGGNGASIGGSGAGLAEDGENGFSHGAGARFLGHGGKSSVLSPELNRVDSNSNPEASAFLRTGSVHSSTVSAGGSSSFSDNNYASPLGGTVRGMPQFNPAFSAQTSRSRSSSPLLFVAHSSTNPIGNSSVGSAVGSSVGARWKRGLAMAGAVGGAAAEAAGALGGLRSLPGWPGVGTGESEGGGRERRGSGDLGFGGRTSSMPTVPPVSVRVILQEVNPGVESLNDDQALRSQVERMGRAEAVPHSDHYGPIDTIHIGLNEQSQLYEEPSNRNAYSRRLAVDGGPSSSTQISGEGRYQNQNQRSTYDVAGQLSRPPIVNLSGSSSNGSSSRGVIPPALAMATGKATWGMDAMKVDLRPGEPLALHRDGVTCAHLVMGANDGQQGQLPERERRPEVPMASTSTYPSCADNALDGGVASLTLCTSSKDCSLKICSLEREAAGSGPVSKAYTRRRLAGGELPLSCCALTTDGKHVVAGSWDNGILLYSVQAAAVLSKVDGAHEDGVRCLALHEGLESGSDNNRMILATGSWDAAIKVWDIRASGMDPNPRLELFDLEAAVQALAFDGTGKVLAAGSEDGMVAVWDVSTGFLLATFSAYVDQTPVVSVHWTQNSNSTGDPFRGNHGAGAEDARQSSPTYWGKACLVLASEAGEICRFSPLGGCLGSLRLDSEVAAMESDGRCTVVACKYGSLRLLTSLDQGGFVQSLVRESGHEGAITCLHVSTCAGSTSGAERGSTQQEATRRVVIATGSEEGTVRVWDVVHRRRA